MRHRAVARVRRGSVLAVVAAAVLALFGAASARADHDEFAGYALSVASTQTAGVPFTVTVTALDSDHDGDAGYVGVRCVTFSGPASSPNHTAPSYPGAGSCPSGESSLTFNNAGKASAQITLYDAQSTTLSIKDALTSKNCNSSTIKVAPGTAASYYLPTPGAVTAGVGFVEQITALDTWGNTATGYDASPTVAFSGPLPSPNNTQPAYGSPVGSSVVFTAGVASEPVTLYDAQSTMLTATAGALAGKTGSFTVAPGSLAGFKVVAPSSATAGVPFGVSITAQDAWQNTVTGFTGSQALSFGGPSVAPDGKTGPVYPASATFVSGVSSPMATVTLYDAQTTALTVSQSPVSGVSGSITVQAATPLVPSFTAEPAADVQVSSTISSTIVGQSPVQVTVADAYGNHAPDGTAVTMSATPVTSPGLGGTLLQTTTSGVASFNDLTLGPIGTYQLSAAVGTQTALSTPFQVVVQLSVCNGGSCGATATNSNESSSATATAASGQSFQDLVLTTTFLTTSPPSGVCPGFTAIPGTAGNAVEVVSGNVSTSQPSLTITFTIPAATLRAAGIGPLQALLTSRICLGAERYDGYTDQAHAWTTLYGQPATYDSGTKLYWGVVPYWTPWLPSANPYISQQYLDSHGDLVIVLVKPYPWDGWAFAG